MAANFGVVLGIGASTNGPGAKVEIQKKGSSEAVGAFTRLALISVSPSQSYEYTDSLPHTGAEFDYRARTQYSGQFSTFSATLTAAGTDL